jgi:hypothetical protein
MRGPATILICSSRPEANQRRPRQLGRRWRVLERKRGAVNFDQKRSTHGRSSTSSDQALRGWHNTSIYV